MIYLRPLYHIRNSNRVKFAGQKKVHNQGQRTHTHTQHTHNTHTTHTKHTQKTHTHIYKFYKNNKSPFNFLNKKFPQAEYQKQKKKPSQTTNKVAIQDKKNM